VPTRAAPAVAVEYSLDGEGLIGLDPWPLGVTRLDGFVLGFEASGYPERPTPVVTAFRVLPHAEAAPSPTA